MGCGHKPRKKVTAVSYESEEDGVVKQSETESLIDERRSDQSESTWLSLHCHPSFLTSDSHQLPNLWDFGRWDLTIDNRFMSMLSLFGGAGDGGFSLFDGSRINPIEEAALVLDTSLDNTDEVFAEHLQMGVLNWLHDSLRDEPKDSPITSAGSFYERSLCEDSSVFESSWTSLSTQDDSSSSQVSDFDRIGFCASQLDLQGDDDFEWVSDKEQRFDAFQSDFPSPSFHIKRNYNIGLFDSGVTSLGDEKSNSDGLPSQPVLESENQFTYSTCEGDLEGLNSGEPLFWPFERNSYWRPEIEEALSMSPIKSNVNISSSERSCAPRSINLRFPEKKAAPTPRRDVPEGRARKVLFRSGSTVSAFSDRRSDRNNSDSVRGINMRPSKLGSCTQGSFGWDSCNISRKKRPLKMKENLSLIHYGKGQSFHLQLQLECQDDLRFHGEKNQKSKDSVKETIIIKHNDLKELNQPGVDIPGGVYEDFLTEGSESNEEVPIEKLVGLNEFNGHEGIDVEFDEGQFSLDGLLFEDPFPVSLSDGSRSIAEGGPDAV